MFLFFFFKLYADWVELFSQGKPEKSADGHIDDSIVLQEN